MVWDNPNNAFDRIGFDEIRINLTKSLHSERPTEPEGLNWDMEMAHAYRQLQDSKAWQHFRDNVLTVREMMVQKLVSGDSGADTLRLAIRLCDDLLRVPQKMITDGARARQHMEEVSR